MWTFRTAIFCLSALLFCSECMLSRPLQKRQTSHEPQQQENDYMLKFALLSRSSGKFVTMLKNGSVFASGVPVQGKLDLSSQWYLHMTRDMYRLENVQNHDHYLAVAHTHNVTLLVAHNPNKPFTLDMMEEQRNLSGDGETQNNTQHNNTNASEFSGSTFSLLVEWNIHSVDTLTNNVMLVRDDQECYLSFNHEGYSHKDICSQPRIGNSMDIVFEPIF